MSNGGLLWFRSTEWQSFYVEGQRFQPDADGYIAVPENLVAQFKHPNLEYVGRDRPKKPEELQTALTVSPSGSTRRGAYRGALEAWMAPQTLNTLQRMGSSAIAREFEAYCKQARPELLRTLPKRLRSMEPMIEQIIAGRKSVARADRQDNNRR
jgi:hypothetical protein